MTKAEIATALIAAIRDEDTRTQVDLVFAGEALGGDFPEMGTDDAADIAAIAAWGGIDPTAAPMAALAAALAAYEADPADPATAIALDDAVLAISNITAEDGWDEWHNKPTRALILTSHAALEEGGFRFIPAARVLAAAIQAGF